MQILGKYPERLVSDLSRVVRGSFVGKRPKTDKRFGRLIGFSKKQNRRKSINGFYHPAKTPLDAIKARKLVSVCKCSHKPGK